jgi:hypothetical protein
LSFVFIVLTDVAILTHTYADGVCHLLAVLEFDYLGGGLSANFIRGANANRVVAGKKELGKIGVIIEWLLAIF